ncbi:MAG: hypothetical protein KAH20_04325 [Methylococcales bacterium]|nr:hypothetical protein [Methylococcales bacterium]
MISNTISSATSLITNTQYKAATANHTIATLPVAKNEVGSAEFNSSDLIKPILSLKEAEIETSAAVKIIETDQKTRGSLFDAIA